jgi:hypothetical protein
MAEDETIGAADPPGLPQFTDKQAREAQRHLAAIGLVAAHWAAFETAIDFYALGLARIRRSVGYCFTSQVIGPARKLDAYIAIARMRGGDKFAGRLEDFAKKTEALAERRNRVVHDPWLIIGGDIPSRWETTARRKLRHLFVEVPTTEVLKLGHEISDHTKFFINLHRDIVASIGT